MTDNIYSAKSFGLVSKKQLIFSDKFIDAMKPVQMPIILFHIYCIQRGFKRTDIITHLIPSLFIADLVTACIHVWFDLVEDEPYNVEDDHIVLNTLNGYSSCHHILTSSFTDIDNDVVATTLLLYSLTPSIVATCLGNKSLVKLCSYVGIFYTMGWFGHKFAHMKRHNQTIPRLFEILQRLKLTLDHNVHAKHHTDHGEHYGVVNGVSDFLVDSILKFAIGGEHVDKRMQNIFRYADEFNTNKIKIRFKGDFEGDIVMYLNNGQLHSKKQRKSYNIKKKKLNSC